MNFKYGMKRDFNKWLASLGPSAPVKTLTELRQWNLAHAKAGAIKYRTIAASIFRTKWIWRRTAPAMKPIVAKTTLLSRDNGIDAVLKANRSGCDTDARRKRRGPGRAGRAIPIIVVPFGMVPNAPHAAVSRMDSTPSPRPFGVGFTGTACSEPRLIELAYAFEQATKRRVAPASAP